MWHHYASQADQFVMGSRGLAPAQIRSDPTCAHPLELTKPQQSATIAIAQPFDICKGFRGETKVADRP